MLMPWHCTMYKTIIKQVVKSYKQGVHRSQNRDGLSTSFNSIVWTVVAVPGTVFVYIYILQPVVPLVR